MRIVVLAFLAIGAVLRAGIELGGMPLVVDHPHMDAIDGELVRGKLTGKLFIKLNGEGVLSRGSTSVDLSSYYPVSDKYSAAGGQLLDRRQGKDLREFSAPCPYLPGQPLVTSTHFRKWIETARGYRRTPEPVVRAFLENNPFSGEMFVSKITVPFPFFFEHEVPFQQIGFYADVDLATLHEPYDFSAEEGALIVRRRYSKTGALVYPIGDRKLQVRNFGRFDPPVPRDLSATPGYLRTLAEMAGAAAGEAVLPVRVFETSRRLEGRHRVYPVSTGPAFRVVSNDALTIADLNLAIRLPRLPKTRRVAYAVYRSAVDCAAALIRPWR